MPSFDEIRQSASNAAKGVSSAASSALDRAKLVTGIKGETVEEEPQQLGRLEELSEYCPKLTFQQRLIGFAISFGVGYLITFGSFSFFVKLIAGNPVPFAINYTCGNILSLSACTFLCGPRLQFRNMFDETRRMTTIVYLSCLAATLVVIFIPFASVVKLSLLLVLILTQFGANVWYSLSYIPYGRRTFLRCLKNSVGLDEDV